jgi:hypothetical protein
MMPKQKKFNYLKLKVTKDTYLKPPLDLKDAR